MSVLYLEEYIDTIESLPNELQRNLTLLCEVDATTQKHASLLEQKTEQLLCDIVNMDEAEKEQFIINLINDLKESLEKAEEKVSLATQTYEMVDRHVRRLDEHLTHFEEEYTNQIMPETETFGATEHTTAGKEAHKRKHVRTRELSATSNTPANSPKSRSKKQKSNDAPRSALVPVRITPSPSLNDLVPIDPNEPTYCLCHRVSFGEMIACDNQDCPIEWFHYECVGLKQPPKGKWYCMECSELRKNGLGK